MQCKILHNIPLFHVIKKMHSRILLGPHTRDNTVRHAKAKTSLARDKEITELRGGSLYYHYVGVTQAERINKEIHAQARRNENY